LSGLQTPILGGQSASVWQEVGGSGDSLGTGEGETGVVDGVDVNETFLPHTITPPRVRRRAPMMRRTPIRPKPFCFFIKVTKLLK